MAIIYILATIAILAFHCNQILPSIALVIKSAFTGKAATGGFAGATVITAIQAGVARGIFSNESGLGSAPIAAAAAKTDEPVEQGLVHDRYVHRYHHYCTLTGLSIIVTGVGQAILTVQL